MNTCLRFILLSCVLLCGSLSAVAEPQFRLTSGRSALSIPFQLYMNLVFVSVRVNGVKTLSFNLDTGLQTTILDSDQARELGLTLHDKTEVKVPGGTLELAVADGVSLALPGVEISDLRVQTLPLAVFAPVLGRPIHGTLGHDFFQRFVVVIDYDKQLLHLHEPETFRYSGSGAIVPVTIENDEPFLRGEMLQRGRAPVPAKLKIDTGSASELGLNGSFVKAERLVRKGQTVLPQPGVALGGITENYVARLGNLRIGKFVFKNPVAGYSKDLERGGDAGTIGGEIFRRFTVIFDYARQRVILEPNGHLRDPFPYDGSGLFLAANGTDLRRVKVLRAIAEGPAYGAGIRDGDEIVAVDGRPVSEMSLEEIRKLLSAPGRRIELDVLRGGRPVPVTFKLRRLI